MLKDAGLLVNPTGPDTIRAVAHLDITRGDIEKSVEIVRDIMRKVK